MDEQNNNYNHRGRTGNKTKPSSHGYICAARWPLENNRII